MGRMARAQTPRENDLLQLRGLAVEDVRSILVRGREFLAEIDAGGRPPGASRFAGRTVCNLFFEDSTRTRVSFTIAARRLGAQTVDLASAGSSVAKGESLVDSALTVEAMGVDAMVVRAKQAGVPHAIAEAVSIPVINAGDGRHEHPTQGLLDALALAEATGRLDAFDLSDLRVLIVGDIANSRVARSAAACLSTFGAGVAFVGPPSLAPVSLGSLGCEVHRDLDAALSGADAVMMLRVQFERHEPAVDAREAGWNIAARAAYRAAYALTAERAAQMRPGAVVMHPGPMNRGLEIDAAVAEGPRSIIRRQVTCGVAVRMAVLERALASGGAG